MALRVHEALRWIEDRLGYLPEEGRINLLNQAGEVLCAPPGYAWRWLNRVTTLSTVASQNFIDLPADFAAALRVLYRETFTEIPILKDVIEVLQRERGPSGIDYYLAIEYTVPTGGTEPLPRFRLFPTPDSAETDLFNLYYRSGWVELGASSDAALIPHWVVPLYREIVLAIVLGWLEADDEAERTGLAAGAASKHLAAVWSGPIAMGALQRDGLVQQSYGQPRNTISYPGRSARTTHYANDTVTL